MAERSLLQAIGDGLAEEMRSDESVVALGEDVGKAGGVFRVTQGLQDEFGPLRVLDTPLAESLIVGSAIGLSVNGMRPVAEIQFADFIYPAFDQIVSELAKLRYRSGGQYAAPLVIRAPVGGGVKGGHYHSQSPEAYFLHTPGLKVVAPSNPYDAKGLLLSSIRDPDPVMFFEPKRVYRSARGEVPEGDYVVPLGEARVVRPGQDVTVIAWGAMLHEAVEACERAAQEDIDCELIDPRTLLPFDIDTLAKSVGKTGRLVVVHEAPRTCGFGAEIITRVIERCFYRLEAQPVRVTGYDTPFPYALEMEYLPLAPRILAGIQRVFRDR